MPPSEWDRRGHAARWDDPAPVRAHAERPVRRRAPEERLAGLDVERKSDLATTILTAIVIVLLLVLIATAAWLFYFRNAGIPFLQDGPRATQSTRQAPATAGTVKLAVANLTATPGNGVSPAPGDGAATAIVTSRQVSPRPSGTTQAAYVVIDPATAQQLSGRMINVRLVARAAATNPTNRFALAYSAGPLGNSGWITFVPTDQFQAYNFRLRVPAGKDVGANYVGIWADVLGSGRALEVSDIGINILR